MALQYWFPLTQDSRQQGLNSVAPTIMGTGITFVAGKLGKAAQFPNNCNSCINVPGLKLQTGSWAAWIKVLGSGAASRQCLISEGRDSYNDGVEFYTNQAGTTLYFKAHTVILSTTIALNTWYHVVGTFGNNSIKLYVDGVLKASNTYTDDMTYTYSNDRFVLGKMAYSYTSTGNYFAYNGCLNDVRVYDHVLSQMEIKELSKGLVLHYPLTDAYVEAGQNLCNVIRPGAASNSTWGGHVTQWILYDATNDPVPFNDGIKGEIVYGQNGSTGGGASRSVANITALPSTTYTYSCYVKPSDNFAYTNANFLYKYEYTALSGGTKITEAGYFNNARKEYVGNGWYRIWGTFTTRSNTNALNISFYTYPNKSMTYWIGGWQIEQKDHVTPFMAPNTSRNNNVVYDTSGFCNNSILNTSTAISTDTAKYTYSTYFGAYNTPKTDINDTSLLSALTNCSIAWWTKTDVAKTLFFTGQDGSHYVMASDNNNFYHQNAGSPTIYRDGIAGTYKNEAGVWHHYVMTGVNLSSWTQFRINSYSSWPLNGLVSDVRIYATVLSADDVKSLYQNSAYIDSSGNVYGAVHSEV